MMTVEQTMQDAPKRTRPAKVASMSVHHVALAVNGGITERAMSERM